MEIKRRTDEGELETLRPHKARDGYYRVEIPVEKLAEVERLASEGCAVRMKSDLTGKVNLIKVTKDAAD